MVQITKTILIFVIYLCVCGLSVATQNNVQHRAASCTGNWTKLSSEITSLLDQLALTYDNIYNNNYITLATWKQGLHNLTTIMSTLIQQNLTSMDYLTAINATEMTLCSLNDLISLTRIWNQLNKTDRLTSADQIFSTLDDVSTMMNIKRAEPGAYDHWKLKEYIRFQTIGFYGSDIEFWIGEAHVKLPLQALNTTTGQLVGASAVVVNLQQYIFIDLKIYSKIVLVKVKDLENVQLNDPYKLNIGIWLDNLSVLPVRNKRSILPQDAQCVYWNHSTRSWSNKGCTYRLSAIFKPICECDQLGTFAIIANQTEHPSDPDQPEPDEIADEIDDILGNVTESVNVTIGEWKESLERVSELITNVTQDDVIDSVNRKLALRLANSSLDIFNRLIEAPKIWNNLSESERAKSSSRIFKSISNLSILINSKQNESFTGFNFTSISFHSKLSTLGNGSGINFDFDDVQLDIPFAAFNYSGQFALDDDPVKIASSASVLKNIPSYLSNGNLVPNSQILSITVDRVRESIELNHPNKLKFVTKNLEKLYFGDQAQCSFWNLDSQSWSTSGCSYNLMESNRSYTVCECNHLTDFAAITDVSNRETPSLAKSILTYICSSITCIFLIWSLYISLRYNRKNYALNDDQFKVKSNRFWLNLSISVWLLVSHLLIMIGMDRTEVAAICSINSLLLLYSLLTAFSFMLMLSIHLYLSTSKRHLFRLFSFKNFALFAYIFPVIIIVVSIIFILILETGNFGEMFRSLTGEYFCWISSAKYPGHIWIFVAPVTLIIIVNCYILSSILVAIVKLKSQRLLHKRKDRQYVNPYTVYILLFNFGIPWILYIFYINQYMATVFSYIFILVNGTQGVALFAEQYYVYWANRKRRNVQGLGKFSEAQHTKSTKFSSSSNGSMDKVKR